MRYYFLLFIYLIAFTSCKKDKDNVKDDDVKELKVLGWAQTTNNSNSIPSLWTESRQLDFLPILNNAHYKMYFSHKMNGKLIYVGIEDIHSPASSKIVMWKGSSKMILSEIILSPVQQERILGISVDPQSNGIFILASNLNNYYYYRITDGGNEIIKSSVNAGAHGIPVYIQANGTDINVLTITQVYSDQVTEGKTTIKHLKNDVVYATYDIPLNEEEYFWNNLIVGSAYIENNVCHLLAAADQSLDYYYLKLSKNDPIVQRSFQTDNYTPAFGAETASISSASGLYEDGRFYVAAKKSARDVACLTIDVRPAVPTVVKSTLEAPESNTTYTPTKVYKYDGDIYLSGLANDFGVYWKNGKLTVPDKSGLSMSRIGYIAYH
ncbi:hypothetical protein [Desertivirga brevis]|uniref:hypothetical protein n=1 Tax=Desertivirga brevis TaxID=2810310 RepID=UPI001A96C245|nr:hypothetical protein [Pedobacter sp. SYSU D00873]